MRRDLLPPWLLARHDVETLVEQHGACFLAAVGFKNNEHLDSFLATGELTQPASLRRTAARKADPIRHQRETLRKRVDAIKRAIKDAEGRIASAQTDKTASNLLFGYKAEQTIEAQQARIAERSAFLKCAETDLELFDLLHETR